MSCWIIQYMVQSFTYCIMCFEQKVEKWSWVEKGDGKLLINVITQMNYHLLACYGGKERIWLPQTFSLNRNEVEKREKRKNYIMHLIYRRKRRGKREKKKYEKPFCAFSLSLSIYLFLFLFYIYFSFFITNCT